MKYTITLTEKQISIVQRALEEWFRLRLGQTFDFADDLSSIGVDLSKDNPNHEWLFYMCMMNRDWIEEMMKGIFRRLWGPYGVPKKKTEDVIIAECIWENIRVARGQSRWNEPFHIGPEPVPKIEKED